MNSFFTVQQLQLQQQQQQQQLRGLSNNPPGGDHDVSQSQRFFLPSKGNDDGDAASNPWTILICVLFVLLLCWCSKPNIPDRRFRKDRKYWMEQRDAKINRSLHIRQVVSADEAGNLQLGEIDDDDDDDPSEVASRVSSIIEDENEVACCSICLEAYRVGDKVAWTARPPASEEEEECLHVFHYECILAWLENPKNDDCPSCRAKVMMDDHAVGLTASNAKRREAGDDDDDDDHGSVNSFAFVIMHGLISRARRASYNLIGKSVSVDSDDAPLASLSEPSPLRRAHTFGGGGLLVKQQSLLRRRSRSVSISEHSLGAEDEDDVRMVFPSSTKLVERAPVVPGAMSLRRVASAGPSTPLRGTGTSSAGTSRRESFQRQTDRIIREGKSHGMHQGIQAVTITESQDSTELSESSTDLLLGRTFSSGAGPFPMMRQRSSSVRTSIREDCELFVVDDLHQVGSEEDGLRNLIVMRNSVSWARDIYDGDEDDEEPTDRTDEDEIMRCVT